VGAGLVINGTHIECSGWASGGAKAGAESEGGELKREPGGGIDSTGHEPMRILLVEDDPEDAELVQEALGEVAGFAHTLARAWRFAEALELLERQTFDVVLLDLWLPDASGFDTLAGVRGRSPGMPVVVLTGMDDESFGIDAVRHGAHDYLVKGRVDGPALARSIRDAIERRRGAAGSGHRGGDT
jgi:DNA-binding response OmpR family regulator